MPNYKEKIAEFENNFSTVIDKSVRDLSMAFDNLYLDKNAKEIPPTIKLAEALLSGEHNISTKMQIHYDIANAYHDLRMIEGVYSERYLEKELYHLRCALDMYETNYYDADSDSAEVKVAQYIAMRSYTNLGNAYRALGRHIVAIDCFQDALLISNDFAMASLNLSFLLFRCAPLQIKRYEQSYYYEISEAAAKRAKEMNSYSDYAPGSATAGYQQMVDEAYALAEKQKAQVDPMYHDKIDALVDRYARRLAENLNERNAIDARVPSILITGGGNFPVAKKAKQNAARDRNYGEYAEIEKLLDKIRSTGRGGISADDDLAVEKLTKKLEGMKSQQAMMKAVNAYYRKHKTLEGCPELTAEQVEKIKASMSQDWRKDPVPFPAYLLTNNNANIRRVRQRIEELSHKTEFVGWTFPGGEAKVNEAENRLQLIFEDKPDADTRQALKSEGFKWAPSQGAWQRQLNQNAIRAAARLDFLRPEDSKSPYQLQPFSKRAEKDVSR